MFDSPYKKYAGKKLAWLPMDTLELFNENLQKRYNILQENNWIDQTFFYEFNSLGFLSNEFKDIPNIMFLGCSLTAGIGIPAQYRWTDLVASKLNLACYNLAIGGASSDTAFRLCLGYIDKLNPKIVIFRRPPGVRLELIIDDQSTNISLENVNFFKPYMKYFIANHNNNELNFLKNSLSIHKLCDDRKIKFILLDDKIIKRIDLARDLLHPGIKSNSLYAEKTLSLI